MSLDNAKMAAVCAAHMARKPGDSPGSVERAVSAAWSDPAKRERLEKAYANAIADAVARWRGELVRAVLANGAVATEDARDYGSDFGTSVEAIRLAERLEEYSRDVRNGILAGQSLADWRAIGRTVFRLANKLAGATGVPASDRMTLV